MMLMIPGVCNGKGKPTVTEGLFIEAKEVLGGYWLLEGKSKEGVEVPFALDRVVRRLTGKHPFDVQS